MPQQDIAIEICPESFAQSRRGNVTGGIYWKVGDQCFPEYGWNDFALVLINAWIESVMRLINQESTSEILHFMDGPFFMRFVSQKKIITCQFIESRHNDREIIEIQWAGSADQLFQALFNVAQTISQACQDFNHIEPDLQLLKSNQLSLQKFIAKQGRRGPRKP